MKNIMVFFPAQCSSRHAALHTPCFMIHTQYKIAFCLFQIFFQQFSTLCKICNEMQYLHIGRSYFATIYSTASTAWRRARMGCIHVWWNHFFLFTSRPPLPYGGLRRKWHRQILSVKLFFYCFHQYMDLIQFCLTGEKNSFHFRNWS